MHPTEGMLPVVLGEPLLLVGPEGGREQGADLGDIRRGQCLGREPAQANAIAPALGARPVDQGAARSKGLSWIAQPLPSGSLKKMNEL